MNHGDMPCGFESYENDWLEVKYATPKQMEEEQTKKQNFFAKILSKTKLKFAKNKKEVACKQNKKVGFAKKVLKPVGVCAIIALLVAGVFLVDGGFVGDVFSYAKDTLVSENVSATKLTLPANATVSVQDGNILLSGGSLAVNLFDGKVTDVTESSVTVCADDGLGVVYSNLSQVYVQKGDVVSDFFVLGKYDQSATVNLLQDGQKITSVSADGYTLSW